MPVVRIEWLSPDGDGGAPAPGGGVVRIAGTLPGDHVQYREVERRGRTIIGELEAIEAASPSSRPPPCRWDAECGGCDLSRLAPEARPEVLGRIAQRALGLPALPPFVASPRTTGHRARVKLLLEHGQVGFRARRSHRLVPIERCAAARPEVDRALGRLREWLGGDPSRGAGLESVELRSDGERVVFAFATAGRVEQDLLASLGDVAVDGRRAHGNPTLELGVAGLTLRCSPQSFYQVNLEINAMLVDHVRACVRRMGPERVLELYAGIGNLSLPIAASGVRVHAVERDGQAIADLRYSATRAGILSIEAMAMPAEKFDPSRSAFDIAVLDPPRAGAPGVLDRVVRNRPRGIVYVSCHVPSAARDLKPVRDAGYAITSVRCFDMFPDTHHFETVITLERH